MLSCIKGNSNTNVNLKNPFSKTLVPECRGGLLSTIKRTTFIGALIFGGIMGAVAGGSVGGGIGFFFGNVPGAIGGSIIGAITGGVVGGIAGVIALMAYKRFIKP